MKNKNRHILLIVFGVVIVLLILNWFGIFDSKNTFNTVPVTEWKEVIGSNFTCNNFDGCNIKAYLECSQPVYTTGVKFRTNVLNGNWGVNGNWIAFDRGTGVLEGYSYFSTEIKNINQFSNGYAIVGSNSGSDLFYSSGSIYMTKHEIVQGGIPYQVRCATNSPYCYCDGSCANDGDDIFSGTVCPTDRRQCQLYANDGEKYYKFINPPTVSVDTTRTPISPYKDDGREMNLPGSDSAYTCSGIFHYGTTQINKGEQRNVPWNSSTVGGDTTKLNYLESAYWENAISPSIGHIFYRDLRTSIDCASGNKPKCTEDHFGFYNCILKDGSYSLDTSTIIPCDLEKGYICIETIGNCSFPLNYDLYLTDSNGVTKTGFGPNETIIAKSKITSSVTSQITNANVKFLIYQYGQETPIFTKDLGSYDFTKNQYVSTIIQNPGNAYLGKQFYIVIAVSYNGNTVYFGRENKDYSFRIASSISCNVGFVSNINGQTRSTLYVGYPVDLNIYVTESNYPTIFDSSNIILSINHGNEKLPINGINRIGTSTNPYTFRFIPSTTGTIDSIITIFKSGIEENCQSESPTVTSLAIKPYWTNINKYTYKCVGQNSATNLEIELKDDLNNYVDSNSLTLKVLFSDTTLEQDISSLLIHDSLGKYHFSYDFPQLGSTYFQLNSEYFTKQNTGAIDVLTNCKEADCTKDSDCQSGFVCQNYLCTEKENPWLLYVAIGAGVLISIVILVVLIKVLNKPKQNIYTGLEGL